MVRLDFEITGGGTVYLLHPLTRVARAWIDERVSSDAEWFAGAVAVEHRYIRDIVLGAISDGLRVR